VVVILNLEISVVIPIKLQPSGQLKTAPNFQPKIGPNPIFLNAAHSQAFILVIRDQKKMLNS
jgi:hypothetical protein